MKALNKINCIVIAGNKQKDALMHHFDLFESFKVLAEVTQVTITLKPEHNLIGIIERLKLEYEQEGQRVIAIFYPNKPDGAWKDDTVKIISNGYNFVMFDKLLTILGFCK